jgi:hypothetical protein
MPPHPEHPEWEDLSMMFFAHRGIESVESAAMWILHTFYEHYSDEVMVTALGLFLAMDSLDPTDPLEVIVRQLLRLLRRSTTCRCSVSPLRV